MAGYAAEHWMAHARVDKVSSRVQGGMEQLFDASKPHFSAWIQLHDVDDNSWKFPEYMKTPIDPEAAPLYYAACCGFPRLAEHLLIKHPLLANTRGGGRGAALHAATELNHVEIARLLLEHGGNVDVRGVCKRTPLHFAAKERNLEIGRLLLGHGADVDSRENLCFFTPLHVTAWNGHIDFSQMLLEHKADVNSRDNRGRVPLHRVSENSSKNGDHPGVVRLLLEHGADVDAKDEEGTTPLHLASSAGKSEIVRLLLDHGANADAEDKKGRTPLRVALEREKDAIAQILTEHGSQLLQLRQRSTRPTRAFSERSSQSCGHARPLRSHWRTSNSYRICVRILFGLIFVIGLVLLQACTNPTQRNTVSRKPLLSYPFDIAFDHNSILGPFTSLLQDPFSLFLCFPNCFSKKM